MNQSCFLLVLFAFAQCTTIVKAATSFQSKEKGILDTILDTDIYDKRIRPNGVNGTGDGPVICRVSITVRNIESISEVNMEYTVQLTLRERWNDARLSFVSKEGVQSITLSEIESVWMPDLFFQNEKRGHFHNVISPNHYIKIFQNGDVLYSTRITLTLSCPMNMAFFPHDRQQCDLVMGSYGHTMNDIAFLWQSEDPLRIPSSIYLPRLTLESYSTDYCNSKTSTGEYSCLRMGLLFQRQLQYYLLQCYIPSCMLVFVSWISFWLDTAATTARVALGITTLLTMSIQVISLNQLLPPVSYTKAIDVWTGVCLTFVFGALLEFAIMNFLSTLENRGHKKKEDVEGPKSQNEMEQQPEEVEAKAGTGDSKKDLLARWLARCPSSASKKVDIISRIVFPIAFAIFNLAYWCRYI